MWYDIKCKRGTRALNSAAPSRIPSVHVRISDTGVTLHHSLTQILVTPEFGAGSYENVLWIKTGNEMSYSQDIITLFPVIILVNTQILVS